ncbi:expressed unknown protein [Seminavis robusta]|uniref:Uncharacterized protein n=1 Tax=Seminavis robusta TaxID=568900 RepID=A0A9N8HEX9_9STRA|nr:expressed unknown protein [Seminavis robusta]|eukprot:Sro406_g136430.1 n/a (284) ;mRNA; r:43496-44615
MEEDKADANGHHGDAPGDTGNAARDVENPPDQLDDDSAVMDCLTNRSEAEAAQQYHDEIQQYQDEESDTKKAQVEDKDKVAKREAKKTTNSLSTATCTTRSQNEIKSEEDKATTKFTEIGSEQAGLPNKKDTAADPGMPANTDAGPNAVVGALPFFRGLGKNKSTTVKAANGTSCYDPSIIHEEQNPEQGKYPPTAISATASGEAVDRNNNPMVPINQPINAPGSHQSLLDDLVERIEPIPVAPTTLHRGANQRPQSRPGAYTGENLQRVQSLDFDLVVWELD